MTRTSTFERSAETQWLVDYLRDKDEASYEDLSRVCGVQDVRKQAQGPLYSARRILQRDEQIVFGVVRGWGLKRLDNVGLLGALSSKAKMMRNMARSGRKLSVCVSERDLDESQRSELLTKQSLFALVDALKATKLKQIESNVKKKLRPLNMGEMLSALRGDAENGS